MLTAVNRVHGKLLKVQTTEHCQSSNNTDRI